MKSLVTKSSNDLLDRIFSHYKLYILAGQLLEQSKFYVRLYELIDQSPDSKSKEEMLGELDDYMTKKEKRLIQINEEIQGYAKELVTELTHLADATYPD